MKKLIFRYLAVVVITASVFTGCNNEVDSLISNIQVENMEELNQTVFAEETSATVKFETLGVWTSSVNESWVSISPSEGSTAGLYTITISFAPNITGNDRSSAISISCIDSKITVSITQKATRKDGTSYKLSPPRSGDVYVVGEEYNVQKNYVAKIWKNGIAQHLTDGTRSANASFVYVSGNDVYVAGREYNAQNIQVAKLWKNGVAQNLTDGTLRANALSVYIYNNDVYVAGYDRDGAGAIAVLWKNNATQNLTDGVRDASATSVHVSGGDVYVSGYQLDGQSHNIGSNTYFRSVAKLWKNGVAQNLSDGTCDVYAESVFVSGSDVYVAGYEINAQNTYIAKIWKNGIAQNLTNGSRNANAYSVFVSGNDVYVAGREYNTQNIQVAKVWKNGIAQNLTDGAYRANASSVFVSRNDVYVAGYDRDGTGVIATAILCKNGVLQNISDGTRNEQASSVFVVE